METPVHEHFMKTYSRQAVEGDEDDDEEKEEEQPVAQVSTGKRRYSKRGRALLRTPSKTSVVLFPLDNSPKMMYPRVVSAICLSESVRGG